MMTTATTIEIILTAVISGAFCGDRMSIILERLFGIGYSYIPHIFCIALLAAAGIYFIKRGYIPKMRYYIAAMAAGILAAFLTRESNPEYAWGFWSVVSAVGGGFTNGAAILLLAVSIIRAAHYVPRPDRTQVNFLLAAALVFNVLAAIYIGESSYIYSWDNATYWTLAQDIASGKTDGGLIHAVYTSIAEMDYNYVPALIPALAVKLFGASRIVYILTIINVYLMPCVWIMYSIAKKLTYHPRAACVTVMLLCPIMFYAAIQGFVDVFGVFLCLLCVRIYIADEPHMWQGILIGAALAAAVVFRRWYAFFAVSFIAVMLIDSIGSLKRFRRAVSALAAAGFILGVYFGDFVVDKLMKNYSELYASYKFDIQTDFKLVTRYFGIIPAAVVFVISILSAVKNKSRLVPAAILQMIICFVMFINTQTHGQQHLLLYVPAMTALICSCISLLPIISRVGYIAAALAAVNAVSVMIPRTQPDSVWQIDHYAVLPDFSMYPKKRGDILSILELKAYLDSLPKDNGETVGILSNSFTLNESIMQLAERSVGINADSDTSYIVGMPSVDSRDREYDALYNVNYMVVAFPAQTHLPDGQQRIVEEAVRSFEQYADIAEAYTEDDREFDIDGIKVKIYIKNRPNTEEEIAEFEERVQRRLSENE